MNESDWQVLSIFFYIANTLVFCMDLLQSNLPILKHSESCMSWRSLKYQLGWINFEIIELQVQYSDKKEVLNNCKGL